MSLTERNNLLASITNTIADYREGDLDTPTCEHVNRWIKQFNNKIQLPLLREMNHVLKQTYFSKTRVTRFFKEWILNNELTKRNPRKFWAEAHILNIQQNGRSQSEIRKILSVELSKCLGLNIDESGADGGEFIYLDDVIFTGLRVTTDLKTWIAREAPTQAVVHIIVIATHSLGKWLCEEQLKKAADDAGKRIDLRIWSKVSIENRKRYRNNSEVLWPAILPEDQNLNSYMAMEQGPQFLHRQLGGELVNNIFSSETARQLLEREMLLAGVRILGFCQDPNSSMRPLGFSSFRIGFGSTIATFRNCPNNTPLALWWGSPNAPTGHPFRKWYPLLPRKTYEQGDF